MKSYEDEYEYEAICPQCNKPIEKGTGTNWIGTEVHISCLGKFFCIIK